jgi:hypothetical protein
MQRFLFHSLLYQPARHAVISAFPGTSSNPGGAKHNATPVAAVSCVFKPLGQGVQDVTSDSWSWYVSYGHSSASFALSGLM